MHGQLTHKDLRYVVTRLPRDIRTLLSENPRKLYVGGGFIRATIAGETPSDIDIFGADADFLLAMATTLQSRRLGSKLHISKNAITLITPDRMMVQFITRWVFDNPLSLVASFDFTICQAAICRAGYATNSEWSSCIGRDFYVDLAGRRLVYTSPVRIEEAGGSLLRVIKYVKRGYSIQVDSLGRVVARLSSSLKPGTGMAQTEHGLGNIYAGLLREVDPSLVVDGFELVDDHAPTEGFVEEVGEYPVNPPPMAVPLVPPPAPKPAGWIDF